MRAPGGGRQIPFSKEQLAALYPTHDDDVAKIKESGEGLVRDRWIFPEHAEVYASLHGT
jgi:Alpha/beta hydrolase domain